MGESEFWKYVGIGCITNLSWNMLGKSIKSFFFFFDFFFYITGNTKIMLTLKVSNIVNAKMYNLCIFLSALEGRCIYKFNTTEHSK